MDAVGLCIKKYQSDYTAVQADLYRLYPAKRTKPAQESVVK